MQVESELLVLIDFIVAEEPQSHGPHVLQQFLGDGHETRTMACVNIPKLLCAVLDISTDPKLRGHGRAAFERQLALGTRLFLAIPQHCRAHSWLNCLLDTTPE